MTRHGLADSERTIARCRIILSVAALIAVYIDPTLPTLTRWLPLTGGPFMLDPLALAVMLSHLGYSITFYLFERWRVVSVRRIAIVSTWLDVAFGAAILLVTEGANSPFYVFFTFAVLAAAFRAGLRLALTVTVTSALIYLGLILVSHPWGLTFYIMRPAYLTITGYLVGYLGEQRLVLESKLRALEAATQREHIARSLHDEYVQALAGVNLRLETCRQLLHRGQSDKALVELTELQAGVNREHDELRTYIRSLLDREATPASSILMVIFPASPSTVIADESASACKATLRAPSSMICRACSTSGSDPSNCARTLKRVRAAVARRPGVASRSMSDRM